jgi:hypothetical protein
MASSAERGRSTFQRGDPVAILQKRKSRPNGGLFKSSCTISDYAWLRGQDLNL